MTREKTLNRLSGIRNLQHKRLRDEAVTHQQRVGRLNESVAMAQHILTEAGIAVAASIAVRQSTMKFSATDLKGFHALIAGVEGDQLKLRARAQTLQDLQDELWQAEAARIAHNKRLNRVQRQCENMEELIHNSGVAAEIRTELEED